MQILLDNVIYSLQRSGGASVVWTEHVKRLINDKRFEVSYLEYNDACKNVFRENLQIPPEKMKIISSRFLQIKRYIDINSKLQEPYIFHSSHYRLDKSRNSRNVTTVHDFVYEYYFSGISKRIHSFQKWDAIRKADVVICISESTKRDLLHFLPDVDEHKIVVVYNGVDDAYHQLKSNDYVLHLPYETSEYALYIGNRITPYKNFSLVVDVCSRLQIPLMTVGGEPPSKVETQMLSQRLGEGRFLQLYGISNKALNELYNRARFFIYPSLYEGFGIPVIEAQRAGVPVICISRSSIPEIVGNTDLCIKGEVNADTVCERIRALENSDYRNSEIDKGLVNSMRFSWDKTYKETTDIYLNLING